ncbi:MAG: hypothetical protein Q8S01_10885, partial [Ignavibacteria bacterium]|nr:hypothetical protein [Ignavibacteria bacterium]
CSPSITWSFIQMSCLLNTSRSIVIITFFSALSPPHGYFRVFTPFLIADKVNHQLAVCLKIELISTPFTKDSVFCKNFPKLLTLLKSSASSSMIGKNYGNDREKQTWGFNSNRIF